MQDVRHGGDIISGNPVVRHHANPVFAEHAGQHAGFFQFGGKIRRLHAHAGNIKDYNIGLHGLQIDGKTCRSNGFRQLGGVRVIFRQAVRHVL